MLKIPDRQVFWTREKFSLAPRLCEQADLDLVSAWEGLDPRTLVSGTLRETFAILTWQFAALRIMPEPP